MIWDIVKKTVTGASGILQKTLLNDSQKKEFEVELQRLLHENLQQELRTRADVVISEIKGESWLQRNWRPILMLSIVLVVINNFLIVPYAIAFGANLVLLDLPKELFNLMSIGVGGYVVGRSAEKVMDKYKA